MPDSKWKSCCCLPNRVGAAIIGILSLAGSLALFILLILKLVCPDTAKYNHYILPEYADYMSDLDRDAYTADYETWVLVATIIYLITAAFAVVYSLVLLVGVIKESAALVKTWLYFTSFILITIIISACVFYFAYFLLTSSLHILFSGILLIALGSIICFYYIFVVYAYLCDLKYF